jgi:hypothetical protein
LRPRGATQLDSRIDVKLREKHVVPRQVPRHSTWHTSHLAGQYTATHRARVRSSAPVGSRRPATSQGIRQPRATGCSVPQLLRARGAETISESPHLPAYGGEPSVGAGLPCPAFSTLPGRTAPRPHRAPDAKDATKPGDCLRPSMRVPLARRARRRRATAAPQAAAAKGKTASGRRRHLGA